ncbi:unnamed protein product [Discula destructiva]
MKHPKRDQLVCNETRATKEKRRDEIEQARARSVHVNAGRSEGSGHQSMDGKFSSPGDGGGVGGDQRVEYYQYYQSPPTWMPMTLHMGSNGGNNGMLPQNATMQNNFIQDNRAMAPPNSAFSYFQPSPMSVFTSAPASGLPQGQYLPSASHNNQYFPNGQASPTLPQPNQSRKASTAREDRGRPSITPPSAASGGVPDPTDAYLMRASFMPKRRQQPGPLLVVIDLNGTLLYRSRNSSTSFESRLHSEAFVNYCVDTFWVVIWSSARPDNVKRMVKQLVPGPILRQVVDVWGRDKFGLSADDYYKRTQCYKRLTKVWDDPSIQSSYPRNRPGFEGGCWDQGNTVLIDDSTEKARSEPHNAITLPEYQGGEDPGRDVLPSVHDYLNELCYQEDVSAYIRAHPFKMAEGTDRR